jgi:hypothetical protein
MFAIHEAASGPAWPAPETKRFLYQDDPEAEGEKVEFRLIYQGKLPAEGRADIRAKQKSLLRKHFHAQLAALWQEHPFLSHALKPNSHHEKLSTIEWLGKEYERCGRRFVPLIHRQWNLACSLSILFLAARQRWKHRKERGRH